MKNMKIRDTKKRTDNRRIREGDYAKPGVTVQGEWTTFTFDAEKEDSCFVVLKDIQTQKEEKIAVPAEYCMGSVRSIAVADLHLEHLIYDFEINGKTVMDPCAHAIMGRQVWNDSSRSRRQYEVHGAFDVQEFDWGEDVCPEIPREQMIMYKLHVRGFTMDSGTRSVPGTFRALMNRIPYLKKLGVTTIELMPVYEFEEIELPKQQKLPEYIRWKEKQTDQIRPAEKIKEAPSKVNYWGYEPGNYFAVKASYAADPLHASREFRMLIHRLHENGMECVMEMYFPEKVNHNLILEALRYWVREYHVDGIHLLGEHLPITAIVQDGMLSRTKIFYVDFEEKACAASRKYPNLYIYKEEYQYPVRQILNHINGNMRDFADQQRKQGAFLGYINYIASNNGFTLADLFMYNDKHNEENGEQNLDGSSWNFSNNYGVEGPTRKRYINALRKLNWRNAVLMLMLAQGVPLLWSGDEMGNSQNGNNNAYCQDNPTGWVNWKNEKSHRRQIEFLQQVIAFRKEHTVLSNPMPFQFSDYKSLGYPDLSYHGTSAWMLEPTPDHLCLGMLYCGAYAQNEKEPDVYVAYNFLAAATELALPKPRKGKEWVVCIDSGEEDAAFLDAPKPVSGGKIILRPQTICVLESREMKKHG